MSSSRVRVGRWAGIKPTTIALGFTLLLALCIPAADAAYVEFTNCMSSNIVNSDPQLLQFVPLNVSVVFDASAENQPLNITVYGNVTGKATDEPYPPADDPSWNDTSSLFGKIPDFISGNPAYTTLLGELNVLSYTPYTIPAARFCNTTENSQCPLGPAFFASKYDLDRLPAFGVHAQMNSTFAFTSISASLRILAGNADASPYGCVIATITPALSGTLIGLLTYLPLAILIMVGIATIAAATLSPWGSSDIFNSTSNFGRDEDLLRLVTPGFADCLSYIQFIVLTGSLTLNYPGFYQPVVSRVAWSSLMFNESLVSDRHYDPIVDGVYQYGDSTTYGLDRMTRLVGMGSSRDTWAGFVTWLVIIVVAVVFLTQVGFALRWIYRRISKVDPEDLRSKNGPFTAGNCIRICLNYFLLPLTSLSFYQLVIASRGPSYSVAIAAILMAVVIAFSVRLFLLFVRTKPRSFLFDDLITVLAYGPLYNTYCDDAAMFGLIPVVVNIVRGIAIGAVQPSGVAQLVVLAICEIVMILTINAFRPFPSATSMNIYHTCFSVIRFITILLCIAFVPSLEVGNGTRGWLGYAVLLIHACVLVFGFFLNAVQTLIEVIARQAGAGGHKDDGSATRGGLVKVFGMRQLSRRSPRHAQATTRNSMGSDAAMLERMDTGPKDLHMAQSRTRSISASSTLLLQQARNNPARMSQNLDGFSGGQITPDASSTFSKRLANRLSAQSAGGAQAAGGIVGLQQQGEKKDPYYRPPRRNTMDALNSPDKRSSADWSNPNAGLMSDEEAIADDDGGEGASNIGRLDRDEFEDIPVDNTRPPKDYAVREVDFYYGVRGPALSSGTRKLKTGPADPTGPVSSATGWFKNLLGGKTKEKHKGFEVVRSARAPPPGLMPPPGAGKSHQEPYNDDPQSPAATRQGQTGSLHSTAHRPPREAPYDDDDESTSDESRAEHLISSPIPARPPSLPLINTVGDIELPSRIGSEKSRKSRKGNRSRQEDVPSVPAIPRKSSRRNSSRDYSTPPTSMPAIPGSPNEKRGSKATNSSSNRLPFTGDPLSTSKNNRYSMGADSNASDYMHVGDEENVAPQSYTQHLRQTSSALGTHAVNDRPSSMGYVLQHRASDAIHHSPDSPDFEGSVAEVLGRPPQAR